MAGWIKFLTGTQVIMNCPIGNKIHSLINRRVRYKQNSETGDARCGKKIHTIISQAHFYYSDTGSFNYGRVLLPVASLEVKFGVRFKQHR